jgi:ribosomal protein L34E
MVGGLKRGCGLKSKRLRESSYPKPPRLYYHKVGLMVFKPKLPYRIIFTCGGCGYILKVFKSGKGRGLYHVTIKRIHKTYGGVCPQCGRKLNIKPKRIEFKTLKEHLDVEASTSTRHLTVRIPTWMYEKLESLVKSGLYKTKADFVLKAIMRMLEEHKEH